MKKLAINVSILLSLVFSLSTISVYAQSKTLISKMEIPFDFSIRDKTLPAGAYRVERIFQDVLLNGATISGICHPVLTGRSPRGDRASDARTSCVTGPVSERRVSFIGESYEH